MKRISLSSESADRYISLPVRFIDEFMPSASAEFVKVYLYLCRAAQDPSVFLSVQDLQDLFEVSGRTISNALAYWESMGLISVTRDGQEIAAIRLLDLPEKEASEDVRNESLPAAVPDEPVPANLRTLPVPEETPKPFSIAELQDDSGFSEFLGVAEFYLNDAHVNVMTPMIYEALGYCYNRLFRDQELAEYLIEYCIDKKALKPSYWRAVADGWVTEDGVRNLEDAKAASQNKPTYDIMKQMGIRNRAPAPAEKKCIDRWIRSFGMDLILEACDRTIKAIHEPQFSYADSILNRWKASGVTSLSDLPAADRAYEEEKAKKAASSSRTPAKAGTPRPTTFSNMEKRGFDYDAFLEETNEG